MAALVATYNEDMKMSKDITDKRFGIALGLCVLPDGVKPVYAGPHFYGKMTYEAMVQVEQVADKHKAAIMDAMQPMIEEFKAIGLTQADEVAKSRAAKG